MSFQPDDLLGDPALDAAVGALAERNAHHFAAMDEAERAEAIETWRDIARAVLTAAAAAAGMPHEERAAEDGGGRAVIVLEDSGTDEVAIHASFYPRLQEVEGGSEVLATPAQATALELLEGIAGDELEDDAPG